MSFSIDLILHGKSRYGVLDHFTQKLSEALSRQGAICRLLNPYDRAHPLPAELLRTRPDITLSFNGLLPDAEGKTLASSLEIPHLAYLVDSPHHFFALAKDPFTLIGCDDAFNLPLFQKLGAKETLFLPHAVERELIDPVDRARPLEVVVLGTNIDYEAIALQWGARYGRQLTEALHAAADSILDSRRVPCYQAVIEAVCQGDEAIDQTELIRLFDEMERFVRGKDRLALIMALKGYSVHVFGDSLGKKGWGQYFAAASHVTVHPPITFAEALQVMGSAQVVLNSCPRIRSGGHERVFSGIACGALVVTEENAFMTEQFDDQEEILLYRHSELELLAGKLRQFMGTARHRVVQAAQEKVKLRHTWDERASRILHFLKRFMGDMMGKV